MLYLDNSATTYILPEVKNDMLIYLNEEYGNPSSKYYDQAINAEKAIENARHQISRLINASENELIFTSGATESNNMVLKGVSNYYKNKRKHIITSCVEHNSILDSCEFLEENGYKVTYLNVDKFGRINIEELEQNITNDTCLVSINWANNEIGSINEVKSISEICYKKNVLFHTDATQASGKIIIDLKKLNHISFLSISAHKMHGPKGIGILYIKSDEYGDVFPITPLLHGGGQEQGLRSGTYSVHNIVGFGKAAEIAAQRLNSNINNLNLLEKELTQILIQKFNDNISFNSDTENKIPGIINVRFKGINNQLLLKKLAPYIAASSGSACSSTNPSHVLQAIGLNLKETRESIRFSFSPYNHIDELKVFHDL